MSIRRIGVLLGKEIRLGSRNIMFIFAVVMPVAITILLSLLFGTVFSGKARLGLVDLGASALTAMARERGALEVKLYPSAEALRQATADGMVDRGLVLPAGFDESVKAGESATVAAYLWGESTMRDRAVSGAAPAGLIRDLAG